MEHVITLVVLCNDGRTVGPSHHSSTGDYESVPMISSSLGGGAQVRGSGKSLHSAASVVSCIPLTRKISNHKCFNAGSTH
jgi:hypothetical protein